MESFGPRFGPVGPLRFSSGVLRKTFAELRQDRLEASAVTKEGAVIKTSGL